MRQQENRDLPERNVMISEQYFIDLPIFGCADYGYYETAYVKLDGGNFIIIDKGTGYEIPERNRVNAERAYKRERGII